MFVENLRGQLRFLRKHRGDAYAERARRLLLAALRLRGALDPRRPGPDVPRGRELALVRSRRRPARMSLRAPPLLLSLPLLGIARLLPEHGVGLWLRLAAATLVLLLPGRLVARALGRSGPASAFVWSVGLVAAALALTFAVHASLDLVLVLLLVVAVLALPFQKKRATDSGFRVPGAVALAGVGLGIALWSIEGVVRGDALFHLGRMRKLDDFGALSLHAVDEFKDGGLHPGYAFPLWHGWLALVAKLAGVDPTAVVLHESSILAPLALVLAYEMGRQVFRSTWLAVATMLAQVAMIALAPGGGGAYTSLELPGTTARQLLVPAVIALFFRFVRDPNRALALTLALAGMDLAFVHPTYALFIAIPLVGFALVRALAAREDLRASAAVSSPSACRCSRSSRGSRRSSPRRDRTTRLPR